MASVLETLQAALDVVILEQEAGGDLRLLTPPPSWGPDLWDASPPARGGRISVRSSFLENFLVDARDFWEREDEGRLDSDPWVEHGAEGPGLPLEATAVACGGRRLLVVRHLREEFAARRATLQTAREGQLARERLGEEMERRTADLRRREREIVARLTAAVGWRDDETGAHVRRIGLYASAMARALGWSDDAVEDIRLAAPMHDIGKIAIADAILLKPDRLSAAERRIIEQHPIVGAQMLSGEEIPLLCMARDIALCHHERWDGSGYPAGLEGEAIPPSARIVALADVYDAMTHDRVYQPAVPEEQAIAQLRRGRGTLFDPRVVDAFFEVLDEIRRIRGGLPDEPLSRLDEGAIDPKR